MKGFGLLLLYFFTWRSVIVGLVLFGLALLALLAFAASVGTLAPNGELPITIPAFVLVLVVPYFCAPKALRTIISNRRLAIVPGLPLQAGLAVLLLTLLIALFLPLSRWLFGAPEGIFWLIPQIFIIASLYTLVMQLLVTSPHAWFHIQWLPLALMVLVSLFREQLLLLATSRPAILALALLACAGWLYLLVRLARRPNFKPAYATDIATADREMASFLSSWSSRKSLSPTASLLLGYPANLGSRALNIVFLLVAAPLLSVALVEFIEHNNDGNGDPFGGTELFLAMSLFTSFVTGAVAWAETGPRARLLWLRVPGSRAQVWEAVERELGNYFVLLLAVIAAIAAVIALYGEASMLLVHYALTLFTLTLYQRCLPLAARMNGWSSLTQALILIASVGVLVVTFLYSLTVANFNLAFPLELCLLLFAVLFRALAKSGFNRVDWQVLRPTVSKRVEATSA
jgi:hypothetical protein